MAETKTYIYGKHALEEALLNNPKSIDKVYLASYFDDPKLEEIIKNSKIPSQKLLPNKLPPDADEGASHQGVFATLTLSKLLRSYKEFVEGLDINSNTCLVLLGELQDPQNVGAVIRSAAAFGVAGVLIPEHNQAPVTGTVIKVSAGMAFRIPLISVANVNTVVRDLKDKGFWVFGLDGEAKQKITQEKFDAPTLFILGNESKGIREKTRDLCDTLVSIPLSPKCESLNAAASAAVALYAWSSKHPEALR